MVSKYLLLAVLFSGLVTWIPRMIPFILVKYKGLPAIVERFLKFLPVSIIFALILSSVVTGKVGSLPQIKWLDFLAVFPTAWIAFRYRNLVGTVLFGVVLIAILRLVRSYSSKISSNHVSVALPCVCYRLLQKSLQTTSVSICNLKTVFEQPAANFLVCSLIFIEYKSAIKKTYHRDRYHIMA
ncbi:branched-chain amino acid transport protein [Streptococcus pneumoniae]|nr:branched-chain amino acid transport protein [Streptococcus pneumoniae]